MAPSTTSALHPIVIDPFKVPPHFTTLGTGLLYDSHARESASTLRTLLLSKPPLLTNQSKPKSWWRAQCLLYDLNAPACRTVQDLRETLEMALTKPGGLTVPGELVELEHQENGKFRKLNAQVREATGRGGEGVKEDKGKGKNTVSKGDKTTSKVAKTTTAVAKDTIGSGKGKKAVAEKDPLKVVKGAPKIAKTQPVNKSTSINLAITILNAPEALTQPKKTARKGPAEISLAGLLPKKAATKVAGELSNQSAPKPRAKQVAKKNMGGPKAGPEAGPSKPQQRTKQAATKGTGSSTFKADPDASGQKSGRAKQTVRRLKTEPNVKKEQHFEHWADFY